MPDGGWAKKEGDYSLTKDEAARTDEVDGWAIGAVFWGYHYDGAKKIWADEEPRLVDSTSDEMKGRDRAIKKWNDVVATPGSGIDKVPGK